MSCVAAAGRCAAQSKHTLMSHHKQTMLQNTQKNRAGGGAAAAAAGGGGALTASDALGYLRDVKAALAGDRAAYDAFLDAMKEFKAQRCVGGFGVRKKG